MNHRRETHRTQKFDHVSGPPLRAVFVRIGAHNGAARAYMARVSEGQDPEKVREEMGNALRHGAKIVSGVTTVSQEYAQQRAEELMAKGHKRQAAEFTRAVSAMTRSAQPAPTPDVKAYRA